jgi:hypothetical protein
MIKIERKKDVPIVPYLQDKQVEEYLRRFSSNVSEERSERIGDFGRIVASDLLTTVSAPLNLAGGTLTWSLLGLGSLTDPGADRIFFWDDGEGASKWLAPGNSIAITTTTLDAIQDIRTTAGPTFAHLHVPTAEFTFDDAPTWIPTDGSGASLAITVNGTAQYVKVGKFVMAWASITYPATADASLNLISGLSFACVNNVGMRGGGTIGTHNIGTDSGVLVTNGGTTLTFRNLITDASYTNVQLSGKTMYFMVSYLTA